MFESVTSLLAEHDDLQEQLADPDLHSDPVRSKRVNRRYAELSRIVAAYHQWKQLEDDLAAARELARRRRDVRRRDPRARGTARRLDREAPAPAHPA